MSIRTLLLLLALGLASTAPALAQGRARLGRQAGARLNQLDNAKIAFITSRLTLSQEQAQRFWPIYNEFVQRRRELNRSARLLRRDATNPALTDAQLRDYFTQDFSTRQQQLNLEKEYFDKLQKVISLRQIAQLFQAERDFTKEVLQRVAGNRAGAQASPAPYTGVE
ncbi:hypothetical protein HHL22_08995 [Hymenobacter sp. RP-2-7]|uniref:Periplasmic heavy metal sensor n=1 Tax=Hymenobacter polaris TaxID=2682546 RepID=A0A7Y0FME9_9BACT|nr:hypothetical protein [Hymenobacter polaris]NML65339.1 hypothetical protein [Hymenobacter polaris]